jgi:hypothetical protein
VYAPASEHERAGSAFALSGCHGKQSGKYVTAAGGRTWASIIVNGRKCDHARRDLSPRLEDQQSTDSQERELRVAAGRMGHEVVEVYRDHGLSGANGRDKRPAFDVSVACPNAMPRWVTRVAPFKPSLG